MPCSRLFPEAPASATPRQAAGSSSSKVARVPVPVACVPAPAPAPGAPGLPLLQRHPRPAAPRRPVLPPLPCLQDLQSVAGRRAAHENCAVKAAGAQQRVVQRVGAVGGRHHQHLLRERGGGQAAT